ncbi:hypothetical protein ACFW04_006315 [Cataglyphis niger]
METDKPSRSSGSNRSCQRASYRRRRKRRRKPWGERIADWTRALIAFLFSNVGIVCLVVGYTIAGAFLFAHIEGKTNPDVADEFIRCRNLTAATLWELTSKMVNTHGGEVDTSSLEETSPRDDENGDEGDDEGDDESDSYDPQHVTVPLTLCLAIMVGYIWGGAILFSEWEDWNMLDGSYFCFVSLSTIGFGDIVPGEKIYSGEGLDLSFIFCSMYLMLGMALIAMCFNLMQEEVIAKVRALIRIIKYIFRCER